MRPGVATLSPEPRAGRLMHRLGFRKTVNSLLETGESYHGDVDVLAVLVRIDKSNHDVLSGILPAMLAKQKVLTFAVRNIRIKIRARYGVIVFAVGDRFFNFVGLHLLIFFAPFWFRFVVADPDDTAFTWFRASWSGTYFEQQYTKNERFDSKNKV